MTETNFKHTDLGLIPHDWEVKTIKEFADITTGSQNTQDHVDDGKYPFFVRSPKVERINKFIFDTEGVITAGDGVGTGKIFHYIKGKFGLHQRCYLMYNFEDVSAKYFYWIFSQHFYDRVQSMTAKSSVDSVRMEMIADMPIPLPPTIVEQERIAGALSNIDTLIGALTEQIEKKRHIKQGTMQQLLTGKKRLAGFTGEWKNVRLSEICDFAKGKGLKKEYLTDSGQYKCILYGEIFTKYDGIIKSVVSRTYVYEGTPSKKGDVLMPGSTTTIGIDLVKAVALNEENVLLGGDVIILRPKEKQACADFLAYLISNVDRNKVADVTQGITIIHLHAKNMVDIVYTIPPTIAEQSAIAAVLSGMDKEIAALEQKRDKYIAIKSGMMQNLLTGKIRLV